MTLLKSGNHYYGLQVISLHILLIVTLCSRPSCAPLIQMSSTVFFYSESQFSWHQASDRFRATKPPGDAVLKRLQVFATDCVDSVPIQSTHQCHESMHCHKYLKRYYLKNVDVKCNVRLCFVHCLSA